jgi:hypothetical protein
MHVILYGSDIKDAHTSVMCPSNWHRMGHDKCYTPTNTQSYLDQGYDVSTKGMHKTALPLQRYTWQEGAENLANKCEHLVSAYTTSSSYPTKTACTLACNNSNNITACTSDCSNAYIHALSPPQLTSHCIIAQALFEHASHEELNALTIAANKVIADTGATSIFIMEGVDVVNKRSATKPLVINLPDGCQVTSLHICNINILGLPAVLTGHIVLDLATASLIAIHPLCMARCCIIFDYNKCNVKYKGQVILRGLKNTPTDLWTLPITPEGMCAAQPRSASILIVHRIPTTHCTRAWTSHCSHTPFAHKPMASNLSTKRCAIHQSQCCSKPCAKDTSKGAQISQRSWF